MTFALETSTGFFFPLPQICPRGISHSISFLLPAVPSHHRQRSNDNNDPASRLQVQDFIDRIEPILDKESREQSERENDDMSLGVGFALSPEDHINAYGYTICTPAKLSSFRWHPGSDDWVMASGDYDGIVTDYDLETKLPIFERDEHCWCRVWSMGYSHSDPVLWAFGSDDGTPHM